MDWEIVFHCWLKYYYIMAHGFNVKCRSIVQIGSCTVHTFVVTSEVSVWYIQVSLSHTVYFWICLKFVLSAMKDCNENMYSMAGGNTLNLRILFWGLTLCYRVIGSQYFEGTYCLHFQASVGPILNFLRNCLQENLFLTPAVTQFSFGWWILYLLSVEFPHNVNS